MPLPLLLGVALAGPLSQLPEQELRFRTCEQLALEQTSAGNPGGAVDVWVSCGEELHKAGFYDRDAAVEGRLTLAKLDRDYAGLAERDPMAYARVLLITVAQHPNAEFPYTRVSSAWLSVINDPSVRQNLGNVRTVELRWDEKTPLDAATKSQLDALVRRYLGDAGFKVEPANSTAAAKAGITLRLGASVSAQAPVSYQGQTLLQVYSAEIHSDPVRFREINVTGPQLSATERADDPVTVKAHDAALDAAARSFASRMLIAVVTQVYKHEELPPP